MRKLIIALVATVAVAGVGVPLAQAQTTNFGGPGISSAIKNYTPIPILKAACRGWGPWCPPGTTRVCGRWRGCWCARC
jgi:hypothetical protein